MKNPQSNLPPGFRFHPTDEELIIHYLKKKITSTPFPVSIIADVDIYKFDPWNLPAKAAFGEKEWYFFSPRDRKYPNGARPNRAAASGYWKATGTDKIIMAPRLDGGQDNVGVKKALVFYMGKPPKGVKTNWIMHEYRLTDAPSYNNHTNKPFKKSKDSSMRLDDWVLCRIYKKSHANLVQSTTTTVHSDHDQEEGKFVQETFTHNLTSPTSNKTTLLPHKSSSFSNLLDAMDYPLQSNFFTDNQLDPIGYDPNQILNGVFDQTSFKYSNSTSSGNCNNNSGYLFQKLPQSNSTTTSSAITSTIPNMENKLKRQLSSIGEDVVHPSKKLTNYCCFTNNNSSIDMDQQYNIFLNQPLFNQQMLLSPHLQFHG